MIEWLVIPFLAVILFLLLVIVILACITIIKDFWRVTQTADVKKVNDQKDTHTQTTITTVKTPDGTVKTVEQINQVADEDTKVEDTKQVKVDQTITSVKAKNNISALVSNDFSDGVLKPSYGVSFQRELIGPVTVGAFGLTSGVLGLSIGINF
jgi:exopolysaccharide biosynthesis protein